MRRRIRAIEVIEKSKLTAQKRRLDVQFIGEQMEVKNVNSTFLYGFILSRTHPQTFFIQLFNYSAIPFSF